MRLVFVLVQPAVRKELDALGIVDLVGPEHFYDQISDVIAEFDLGSPEAVP